MRRRRKSRDGMEVNKIEKVRGENREYSVDTKEKKKRRKEREREGKNNEREG